MGTSRQARCLGVQGMITLVYKTVYTLKIVNKVQYISQRRHGLYMNAVVSADPGKNWLTEIRITKIFKDRELLLSSFYTAPD